MDVTIRPFRENDAEALAALTEASIRDIGSRAYTPEQIAAWVAPHPVPERFRSRARAGSEYFLAVDAADRPLAFALLEPDGHLDMLYCHPDHAGRGLALQVLAAAERHARAARLTRLYTEASELARPVFAKAGYVLLRRRDFTIGPKDAPVPIHNYAMEKRLD
ncbi:GNAT family N-acetyltransferase [Porphyrobacter sp. YT40]|uniref:GNAT family N-acetyltransferase n=1 Tax=Porphyrobacter sp. YT40 TaxID=2547601 RepID=UPI00114121BC|nr:GNAT family N-acetyltransferase [Porphyrobacter sp. YT40]QDH36211.1 GNAT family N-acetyltransferase [Porphyrobacter sp. YT40]